MKRRPFPGSVAKQPPRTKITSTVTTLIVAGITYALIVRQITPNYVDYSPVTDTVTDFAKQSVRDAYVAERVKQLKQEANDRRASREAVAKESKVETPRESVAGAGSATTKRV